MRTLRLIVATLVAWLLAASFSTPTRADPHAAAQITAWFYHTCAVTTGGGAKCWGYNSAGELGDGSTTHRHTPVDVVGLQSGVAAMSAAQFSTCAITTGGGVKCWGNNSLGELGDGTDEASATPVDVVFLGGVVALAAGEGHTCALKGDSTVSCWGDDSLGQIGGSGGGSIPAGIPLPGATRPRARTTSGR